MFLRVVSITKEGGRAKRVLQLRCDICHVEHEKDFRAKIKDNKYHYCSRKCYAKARERGGLAFEASREKSLERYGVEHPMQSRAIQRRLQASLQERYGVEHNFQIPEVIRSREKTFQMKYNGHPMKCSRVIDKFKETNLARHGVLTPLIREDVLQKTHSADALNKKHDTQKKNKSLMISRPERMLGQELQAYFGENDVIHTLRKLSFCIDFYVKSIKTYIQVDGVYWHGLDRPLDEIKNSDKEIDREIYKKYRRDRKADAAFKEAGLFLVRVTDKDVLEHKALRLILHAYLENFNFDTPRR